LTAKNYRQVEQWLQEGITAAKAGQHKQARLILLDLVEQDQTNEAAWFWLYQVFERQEDKRVCLENLITINPRNEWAQSELLRYQTPIGANESGSGRERVDGKRQPVPQKQQARPVALKLVIAFWTGVSLVFLGGGVIASGNWLISTTRSRTFPNYITGFQAFELLIAIMFIIAGIMGLIIATTLHSKSMAGFYGSLILALGLLLVGPMVSLIVDPPNYLTMICTGGISGMMVLLTLASQPGFNDT
jgi:hypothetical protein